VVVIVVQVCFFIQNHRLPSFLSGMSVVVKMAFLSYYCKKNLLFLIKTQIILDFVAAKVYFLSR
jgi:hypothetical protein